MSIMVYNVRLSNEEQKTLKAASEIVRKLGYLADCDLNQKLITDDRETVLWSDDIYDMAKALNAVSEANRVCYGREEIWGGDSMLDLNLACQFAEQYGVIKAREELEKEEED